MKKFKIIGPETSREFTIEDDEMLEWNVIKIKDYKSRIRTCKFCNKEYYKFRLHCPNCGKKPKGLQEVGG